MSNTPHRLNEEFPAQIDALHALKQSDAHFAKTVDRYEEVNDKIHLAETNVEPADDMFIIEMRKERMKLKDEIAAALKAAAAA
jgi:hypothetical protein